MATMYVMQLLRTW